MVSAVYIFRNLLNNSSIVKQHSYKMILEENGSLFSICQQTAEGRYQAKLHYGEVHGNMTMPELFGSILSFNLT